MKYYVDQFVTTDPMTAEAYRAFHGGVISTKSKEFVTLPLAEGLEMLSIRHPNCLFEVDKEADHYNGECFSTDVEESLGKLTFDELVHFVLLYVQEGIAVEPALDFYLNKVRLRIRDGSGAEISKAYAIKAVA